MLHSFVAARLLPLLPNWAPHGREVAASLDTEPFLALNVYDETTELRVPNLFVITSLLWSKYFLLNPSSDAVGSLTVVPPLPFKGPY